MSISLETLAKEVERGVEPVYRLIDERALSNHAKVLAAFHKARVSDYHLKGSTGYGYGDSGRDTLEKIYADIFRAEKALVRGQIVSGTHAIALCLYGVLRPGDELLSVQGEPYDTLAEMIGLRGKTSGSLKDIGVIYRQVELTNEGNLDFLRLGQALSPKTKMVLLQRSAGYRWGASLGIDKLREAIKFIKERRPDAVIFVDNCYGEFVELEEPVEAGADLVAGSLIKNPGGGLAPTGGYVVGQEKFVDMAASRWSAPGIGAEVGPSGDIQRLLYQGLFLAPHVVSEALKGAVFASMFFEKLGYKVLPGYSDHRSDIVQAIMLGTPERMMAFCRGLQKGSPVDSHVMPVPDDMPGYGDPVIMAAGTFIQGASLELSADGPIRPPYAVYLQGGLSKEYIKLALLSAAHELLRF
ncbi:MAG: methionine gamma-lyase family protein [Desulfotomaculaceae bacterium]|nr:methionine gamma-lyase family protein [Desulfotomaculaceae bacterium]MDD4766699.1 methionine gamma-lyase family protein [Desulfotomaculaceae bacterium]